jgi:hypothetical protein
LRVLDLFSGLGGWSQAFLDRGHDVLRIDINRRFHDVPRTVPASVLDLSGKAWRGTFDIVVASPPCECFSVASIGHHWTGGRRAYVPKTAAAQDALALLARTINLIRQLEPRYWWLENPRGLMRKTTAVAGIPRTTVWYCRYGDTAAKPTDLWGRWPTAWHPRPACRNGHPDHEAAPRGARSGTQGKLGALRSLVPYELSLEVCLAVERSPARSR